MGHELWTFGFERVVRDGRAFMHAAYMGSRIVLAGN
jgi:hypothetical protein